MTDTKAQALELAALGFRILPLYHIAPTGACGCGRADCANAGKHPRLGAWQERATNDIETISSWFDKDPRIGIGVATGKASGVWVLDIDTKGDPDGYQSLRELEKEYGEIPETLTALTGSGGAHYYFRAPENVEIRNRAGVRPGIDVRGEGGYVVAPPSPHKSGTRYTWEVLEEDATPQAAPDWLVSLVTKSNRATQRVQAAEEIAENRNDSLMRLGCALRASGLYEQEIAAALQKANKIRCRPPLSESEVGKIASSCANYQIGSPDRAVKKIEAAQAMSQWTLTQPALERANEVTLGRELLAELEHGASIGAAYDEGRFWVYDRAAGYWKEYPDQKLAKMIQAYEGRDVYAGEDEEGNTKYKRLNLSSSKVSGAVKSAIRDAYKPELFSAAPRGICCANGFLSVTSEGAELRGHEPLQLSRNQASWAWDPTARCGRWFQFLLEVFEGPEVEQKAMLLQEFAGAALVAGLACDLQRCLVLFGVGSNGKSVAMEVISSLIPPEARSAVPPHAFGQDYAVSALRGIQLNAAGEIPDASIGSSDRFKSIIAGEVVQAREPFKPSYSFRPVAAHCYSANSLPGSSDSSKGYWRRFMVLSFDRVFEKETATKGLAAEIISSELSGIASWAVDGAVRLLRRGEYTIPASSRNALSDWKHSADQVAQYVAERCRPAKSIVDRPFGTKASVLYSDYRVSFCDDYGYRQLSLMRFSQRLRALGLKPEKRADGIYYPVDVIPLGENRADWGDDIAETIGALMAKRGRVKITI